MCRKLGRGLKVNGNIIFSGLFTLYVLCIFRLKLKTEDQVINQKASLESYKIELKILANPRLAY